MWVALLIFSRIVKQAAEAAKIYAQKYQSRYGLLSLLGMPQGVSLESVYTPVRFLNELSGVEPRYV
ncbi:MAG: hypothetical protein ACRC80_03765 [Waterburya sp.]